MKQITTAIIPNAPVTEGNNKYNLSEYIKICREREGFSIELGARFLNLSEDEYAKLESGDLPITAEMLNLAIKIYKMPKRLKNLIPLENRPAYAVRMVELRLKEGKTQTETAARLGIAQQTYAGYESGRNEPDIKTFLRLADIYKVSTDYLLGRLN